ncbi:MAG: ferritin-like domain-containing protein [Longimicrobiales bacterium]
MKFDSMEKLYVHELKDLYSAEQQILKALPKMEKAASNPTLRSAFEKHRKVTEKQVERLEKIFSGLEHRPSGQKCKGMEGVLEEGNDVIKEGVADEVRDAALISAAQRVEHYEIAGYGSARTYANVLGRADDARLLQQTLDEEGETDKELTRLAEGIVNREAARV